MSEITSCLLPLKGELTIGKADAARDQLLAALERAQHVMVDLSGVAEFDSAGLQILLAAKKSAAGSGKTLRFTDSSLPVLDVLNLVGLAGLAAGR